jgi:uncharacterized metal-binding protein YceD (DUF177 family)
LDEEDNELEGGFVYLDEASTEDSAEETKEESTTAVDPRWEKLKKLKNKE